MSKCSKGSSSRMHTRTSLPIRSTSQLSRCSSAMVVRATRDCPPSSSYLPPRARGELVDLLSSVRTIPGVRSIHLTSYVEVLKGFFVSNAHKDFPPDQIDIAIIAMLQRDGRTSYKRLSAEIHLSPSSVRERVTKLLDAGVIRISAIRPGGISRSRFSIGPGISAQGDLNAVRDLILSTPAVDFAARTHGSFDFIATVHGHVSVEVLEAVE